jgi:hypothetical protein
MVIVNEINGKFGFLLVIVNEIKWKYMWYIIYVSFGYIGCDLIANFVIPFGSSTDGMNWTKILYFCY